ncbi:Sporulation initiation factor Spo0A C terminal [Gracilibacillus ureilyticus]|uniref:Sporulation initiation factor Spo0A C terminal n=1 Tax=Gracilibacillus ureilyticus TaxID=531814 RepID=A0A1H9U522_9BACI|nr:sporulation initiation factor Spo0A C-terminal domain-containing protein [Gracilibacillus ureilyticus]SES04264.1 Sporulation initiation factor Spo0A C terminal [Gracilibacillus ureilyticus]
MQSKQLEEMVQTLLNEQQQLKQEMEELKQNAAESEARNSNSPENNEINLEEKITELIQNTGITMHIKGYKYLSEAVQITYYRNDLLGEVTKVLYPLLANMFNTTASRVERAIRHAVEVAWSRGNREFWSTGYFSKEKPGNAELIGILVNQIKADIPSIENEEQKRGEIQRQIDYIKDKKNQKQEKLSLSNNSPVLTDIDDSELAKEAERVIGVCQRNTEKFQSHVPCDKNKAIAYIGFMDENIASLQTMVNYSHHLPPLRVA